MTDFYNNRSENPGKKAVIRLLVNGPDKTTVLSAGRWLAAKQKQDIYQCDLAGLVSKYIGETEKNLEQLFNRSESMNWILLFDEADALFGKRTGTGTPEDNAQRQAIEYFIKR